MKNKRAYKKALSVLFSVVLLISGTMPISAHAENAAGSLCLHHQTHTAECGYTEGSEGTPCSHTHCDACGYVAAVAEIPCNMNCTDTDADGNIDHQEGCVYSPAVEGSPCQHQHDENCGYSPSAAGTPCTYVCEICNSQSSGDPAGPECTCETLCTEDAVNTDCPVCGADGADLTLCKGNIKEVQALIDALPTEEELEAMDETAKAEVFAQIEAIYTAIAALDETDAAQLDMDKLNALAYFVMEVNGIDRIIVEDSAKLEGNGRINITRQSDAEYTISYPGVTEDTPLKYDEDFVANLGKIVFSAEVVDLSGNPAKKPTGLNINNTKGALDYSEVTEAAESNNGSIPAGSYIMTLDFSKIGSTVLPVKDWKSISFEGGSQIVTIRVEVGTDWGDNSVFDDYRIKTVNPNNVTFNLFDYWVDGETAHTHLNEGTSSKTRPTCGIPSCMGETQKVIVKSNVAGSGYELTGFYNKGINENHALVFSPAGNLTGGWNFNTNNPLGDSYLEFKGGPYYGLVENTLGADGYPVLNLDQLPQYTTDDMTALQGQERPADESLAYLFDPDVESGGKRAYTDVKNFLKRDPVTGYYKYSSLENFASYNRETGNFDVYNSWAVQGGASVNGQFFPFNQAAQVFQTDESGMPVVNDGILVPNSANGTNDAFLNHYLGLTMEVTFQQPAGGKLSNMGAENPMTFRFSGDDDVWIFIDGVLVADIGGIHDTETATIDFSTGEVKIDRTDRFDDPIDPDWNSRVETTIREQFEKAGAVIDNEMKGDTFADNTVHTLTMFYMERGNQASNLELEFNLQEPHYGTLEKVDQDGSGLEGVTFNLYEADDDWQPIGEEIATLTTGKDGMVNLTQVGADGVERILVFEKDKKYILREVETLPGYATPGDIHLTYNDDTATLKVENQWETGAVGGFKAQVTMMGVLLDSKGNDLTEEARDGLIIAVPMYNPIDNGAEAKEGWIPVYGSTIDGFQAVEVSSTSDEAYRRAALEAALHQFGGFEYEDWHLYWNSEMERYEGILSDLPGSVENYVFVDEENGNTLTSYYLLNPSNGLFDGCQTDEEKCEKLKELAANGNIDDLVDTYQDDLTLLDLNNFNRQFYSELHIPNKMRELLVQKLNEADEPLAGAEFTLFSDADCVTPVAKGVTDADGFISFSAKNTGNNAVTNPNGGLSSQVQYDLAQYLDEATGIISEKKLWLKETNPPAGYELNQTVTEVLITNDYLYADAGTIDDNVSVARGLGRLVETMARYASGGTVDITLRDIEALGYKYTGDLDSQGFPTVGEPSNWTRDDKTEHLKLHYGLDTALLDYGTHDGSSPVFVVEEGWYGIGMAQNREAHNSPDDPYYNSSAMDQDLSGKNISGLFTGSTIIIYRDDVEPTPGTGSLTVSKTVTGDAGNQSKEWNFTVTLGDTAVNGKYGAMTFTNGVAQFTLKHNQSKTATGLPLDITYEVVEQEANQDGYTTTSTGASGMITENGTAASFVNMKNDDKPDPDPKTGDLIVSKTVSGKRGDTGKDFHFTVTLGDTSIDGQYGDMTFLDGVAAFTLKHGQSKKAAGLPAGLRYTVTESGNAGYTVTSTGETGSIPAGDTAVALFNNHKSGDDSGNDKVSVTVKKVWKLDNGGKATDTVTVVLLKDGKEYQRVELSDQNGWTYTWAGLSDQYAWTVTEANVPDGFTSKVDQEGMTFTITNDDKPPVPETPSDPDKPTDDTPKTGDETNLALWLALLGISGMGVAITLLGSKHRYKEKHNKR